MIFECTLSDIILFVIAGMGIMNLIDMWLYDRDNEKRDSRK